MMSIFFFFEPPAATNQPGSGPEFWSRNPLQNSQRKVWCDHLSSKFSRIRSGMADGNVTVSRISKYPPHAPVTSRKFELQFEENDVIALNLPSLEDTSRLWRKAYQRSQGLHECWIEVYGDSHDLTVKKVKAGRSLLGVPQRQSLDLMEVNKGGRKYSSV
jgi:hypothetical protein